MKPELDLYMHRIRHFAGDLRARRIMELEKLYGKYLYLPFAIEPILPDNQARFKEWYLDVSVPVRKIGRDIAGGTSSEPYFRSVDNYWSPSEYAIWEQKVLDIFAEFQELREKVKQLPIIGEPKIKIWSSMTTINPHRDHTMFWDLPMSFRATLFDENPGPTLYVSDAPPNKNIKKTVRFVPKEVNAFGWNNLRVKHGSIFDRMFMKALLIVVNDVIDPDAFANLMERSIAAATPEQLYISDLPLSAYSPV